MISNPDIFRAAKMPIDQHGEDAPSRSARRANELSEGGDVYSRNPSSARQESMAHLHGCNDCRSGASITFGTYNPEGMNLKALREVVEKISYKGLAVR